MLTTETKGQRVATLMSGKVVSVLECWRSSGTRADELLRPEGGQAGAQCRDESPCGIIRKTGTRATLTDSLALIQTPLS